MKMYVGNASIQRHEFTYRIPGQGKARTISIGPMSQALLPDDMDVPSADSIIEQFAPYGFASVAEVQTKTVKRRFTRLCYSLGSPISSFTLQALLNNNQTVLTAQGKEMRQQMAVATNDRVIEQLEQHKREGLNADITDFEMTIQEDEPDGGYPIKKETIGEGIRVEQPKTDEAKAKVRGRRKKT